MTQRWVAFYFRPLSEYDPFDVELHGWSCEGNDPDAALTELERNPAVPYRLFLLEVIPAVDQAAWVQAALEEAERLGVTPPTVRIHKQRLG